MVELRETDTARAMLRQTHVFQRMRQDDPDRLMRLERLCNQTYFDIRCDPVGFSSCCPVRRIFLVVVARSISLRCPGLQGGVWRRAQGQAESAACPLPVPGSHSGPAFATDGPYRTGLEVVCCLTLKKGLQLPEHAHNRIITDRFIAGLQAATAGCVAARDSF